MSKFTCYSNEVKWADGRRFASPRCLGIRPCPVPVPHRGSPSRPCRDLWNMILLFILLLICSLNISVLHAERVSLSGLQGTAEDLQGKEEGEGGGLVTESACWKCCGTIPWDRQCAAPARASIYLSMPAPFGGIPAKSRLGNGAGIGLCFRPLSRQAIITIILYTLVRVQHRNGPDGRRLPIAPRLPGSIWMRAAPAAAQLNW